MYIGTALSKAGYEVNILDANNMSESELYGELVWNLSQSIAVGLSVMTAQIPSAINMSRFIKEEYPYMYKIWGGVHPSLYPEQVALSEYVDFVVKGEGEETAVELFDAIKNKEPRFDNLKGVLFKNPIGELVYGGDKQPMDINKLSYPQWGLLHDVEKYGLMELSKRTGVGLPLLSSRGCPHRCSFCIGSVQKIKYRFRDASLVLEDIRKILESGVNTISFWDEDFFANKKRLIEILDGIEKRGLKFRWFGTARADYFRPHHIDYELAMRLKQSGCQQLGIGVESGSQRVLDMIKKDITLEDSLRTAELLNKVGIDVSFSYMDGLPDEKPEEIENTIKFVAKINSYNNNYRTLGPFVYRPYAGSVLYNRCKELGMKEPETLEGWVDNPYIGDEIKKEDYDKFPWIQYPMDKLVKLNFYAWLSGLSIKYKWATKTLRKIGQWRCNHLFIGLSFEMWLVNLCRKINIDKILSVGKFGRT